MCESTEYKNAAGVRAGSDECCMHAAWAALAPCSVAWFARVTVRSRTSTSSQLHTNFGRNFHSCRCSGIAYLGGPHLVSATRDYFSVLSRRVLQYGKIVPSRRDQMRPPEDRVQRFHGTWCGFDRREQRARPEF